MNKLIPAAVVALVALAGVTWWSQQGASPDMAMKAVEKPADPVPGMVLGKADAPVTIVEYGSFSCPHCRDFAEHVFPDVKKNYIDTGKAKLEYREFYLNQLDLAAATIAQCGGPMRYFGILNIYYAEQDEWVAGGDPAKSADALINIAKRAGLSEDQAKACMADEKMRDRLVATFQWHATEDDVHGTPTFFIDGERYSNMSYADFSAALDKALAKHTN